MKKIKKVVVMLALLGMTTSSISAQAAESQSNNTYQQNE